MDITKNVAIFNVAGVEVPAQTLIEEKCRYTYLVRGSEEKIFFGRVVNVDSSIFKPEVTVLLKNIANTVQLPARLYGTPDRLGVYIENVNKIEYIENVNKIE